MALRRKKPNPEDVAAAHEEAVAANRKRKLPRKHESAFLTSPMADKLWNPDYCQELIRFYDRTSWEANKLDKYGNHEPLIRDKPPSLARFALHVGVTLPIVKRWLALYPAFAEAYETAQGLEESYFLELGAAGISPGFAAAKLKLNKDATGDSQTAEAVDVVFQVAEPVGQIKTTNMRDDD